MFFGAEIDLSRLESKATQHWTTLPQVERSIASGCRTRSDAMDSYEGKGQALALNLNATTSISTKGQFSMIFLVDAKSVHFDSVTLVKSYLHSSSRGHEILF